MLPIWFNSMNLLIVDTGSLYYALVNALTRKDKLIEQYDKHVLFNYAYIMSGAIIHDIGYQGEFQVFFAGDTKDYWRHLELKKHGINYKGNRAKQPWREQSVNAIRTYFTSIAEAAKSKVCHMWSGSYIGSKPGGYEADDLASGVIQEYYDNYENIFVLTVDCDWLPFTELPKVTWLNTAYHAPRVRRYVEAMNYCRFSKETTKTIARRAFKWEKPTDLWRFKAEFGDTSDNLRGNLKDQKPKFYNPYIDLFHPLEQHRCWAEPGFKEIVDYCLSPVRNSVPFRNLSKINKGQCILAIPPHEDVVSPTSNSVTTTYSSDFLERMGMDTEEIATW